MDKIPIDEKTKQLLFNLIKVRDEVQTRLQLILQVYLNAKGIDGIYNLSPDGSELIKAEVPEEDKSVS
jgi:hypothetical protein